MGYYILNWVIILKKSSKLYDLLLNSFFKKWMNNFFKFILSKINFLTSKYSYNSNLNIILLIEETENSKILFFMSKEIILKPLKVLCKVFSINVIFQKKNNQYNILTIYLLLIYFTFYLFIINILYSLFIFINISYSLLFIII